MNHHFVAHSEAGITNYAERGARGEGQIGSNLLSCRCQSGILPRAN
jgi:hypothetical protein